MSNALIDYHVARARGGVGLTIIELMAVHSSAYPFLVAGSSGVVEGYQKLMELVRPHEMRVFQQLGHLGNEISQADGSPPWSSSDSIGAFVGVPAEPISIRQIAELIESYVQAAMDCAAGGLDGVELHMAHGYLVQQFLSPLHNRRKDSYGGSFENRTRLTVEIATAVRAALPTKMALGVRLSSEEAAGGLTPDDISQIATLLTNLGLIDYINLTLGTDYEMHRIIGAMHEPAGYELESNAPIMAAARLPVLVTGRFRTLEDADQVIAAGKADLVALTRAHIADPDIVMKTREGRVDEIRPCIGCNHGCIGGLLSVGRIGCAVNVSVGAEAVLAEHLIELAAVRRKILVVGGGPAGLEAARVAALRGHSVILAEAAHYLGGCVAIARRAPRRLGIGDIIDWQEREVFRLGVDVRLSTLISGEDVIDIAPDVVIVATGSLPRMDGRQFLVPGYLADGIERPEVVSSHELLMNYSNRDWGRSAVVYDDAGHYEGVAAAEFLIEKGLSVTFVTSHASFAPGLATSLSADPALERLARGDFRLVTYGKLLGVSERRAHIVHRYGGAAFDVEADTVVFISHNSANRSLVDDLSESDILVLAVGDARSPRYLQTAIREGHLAARSL
jgi:2,4-dienoyl-CoA reductase-like NADH-dependent reductase (Old Yellow Enzyme family)